MLSLLSFLLLLGSFGLGRRRSAVQAGDATEQRVVAELRERMLDTGIEAGSMFAEDGIGVFDVGGGEGLDGVLKRRETGHNLRVDQYLRREIMVVEGKSLAFARRSGRHGRKAIGDQR